MHLNVHSITHGTLTNGPGKRNMLHVQGCTLKCKGCFSPHTWSTHKGRLISVEETLKELLKGNPDGITISGGEPMQQPMAVFSLLERIRASTSKQVAGLSVLMYTGYTVDELKQKGMYTKLSHLLDAVVAGRYDVNNHTGQALKGSENQQIIVFSDKHTESELSGNDNLIEVVIDSGEVRMTGFPTKGLIKELRTSLEGKSNVSYDKASIEDEK